jgi:TldD protein
LGKPEWARLERRRRPKTGARRPSPLGRIFEKHQRIIDRSGLLTRPMPALAESSGDLAFALSIIEPKTSYAEVMAEASRGAGLRLDQKARAPSIRPRLRGAVFRAWNGSSWSEVACSSVDRHRLVQSATELRNSIAGATPTRDPPGEAATTKGEKRTLVGRSPEDLSMDDRASWAKRIYDWATGVPGIGNAFARVENAEDERLFLSTAGARCYQQQVRVLASALPLAIEGSKVEYDFLIHGGMGGLEILDGMTEEKVRATAEESLRLLKAKTPATGRMNVVLDPSTSGTFAHESFGHGTEADQLLRDRSYLKPILGQVVGPESLTLVDDGSYDGGWGSIYFDDEGHPSQRTVMVDHGRFVEVLHDRESAEAMGRRPTGNTRRADFESRPFVRMTNTFVEPGDWSLEELLEEARTGLVLESCANGIEDPLGGNMQIKVKKAHRIENGEIGEIYSSLALSGKVLDVLKSIRGIGKSDRLTMSPGFCGKGHSDLLPAGTGGPYLLTEAIVGPA